eukprot:scaffold73526_cov35-Attheya_sp.AAC.3
MSISILDNGGDVSPDAHFHTIVHGVFHESNRVFVWNDVSRIGTEEGSNGIGMDVRLEFVQLLLVEDLEPLYSVLLALLFQGLEFLQVGLCEGNDEGSVLLVAKAQFLVELGEHLVAGPAEFGAVGAWRVVVARVDNARVALGGSLRHVIGRLQHERFQRQLGQLARHGRPHTPRPHNHHIVLILIALAIIDNSRIRNNKPE